MKTDTPRQQSLRRQLSLRRTLLFTAIGVVLAFALALSSLARAALAALERLRHHHPRRKGSSC